jgi:hypothetical protein
MKEIKEDMKNGKGTCIYGIEDTTLLKYSHHLASIGPLQFQSQLHLLQIAKKKKTLEKELNESHRVS